MELKLAVKPYGLDIKVTKLASGVPIGADMEYVDSLTLERALNDRKIIE